MATPRKASYAASVFINCPFEPDYRHMLFAATFAILDCGYQPRCAQEVEDGGEGRIEKIKRIISACKFGVHDISRTELSANGLPRFNMPFELGIFLGARHFGPAEQQQKVTLVVDSAPYRYQAFLSDIAGQDIRVHHGTPEGLIASIRDWLSNATNRLTIPGAASIQERYRDFEAALPGLCRKAEQRRADLLFNEYAWFAASWLKRYKIVRPVRGAVPRSRKKVVGRSPRSGRR